MDRTSPPESARTISRWWLLFALLPAACVGHIGADGGGAGAAGGPGSTALTDAAPAHLHHLTAKQYVNTVRELLGANDAAPVLVDDEGDVPSMMLAEKLNDAADYLVSLGAHTKLVPCAVAAGDDTCAKSYIASFGARAFRRPLTDEETTWLFAEYGTARATNTFSESIDQITRIILQSPQLFYISEQGIADMSLPDGLLRLGGYERASRLSYLLWDSMPDAALTEAARAGKLDTAEGVAAQARRMLDDDRAKDTLRRFLVDEWLELGGTRTHVGITEMVKDPAVFPLDSADLRAGMRAEAEHLVDRVFADGGSFKALLTSTDAYVNEPLARLYGIAKPPAPGASAWVTLDPTQRSGMLTRAGFLAVYSNPRIKSPIRRGALLIKSLLCEPIGNPPPTVNPTPIPPTSDGGVHHTVRESVMAKTSAETCASCHGIINRAGFAFEHYDGIGQWEALEKGIDPDGTKWSLPIDWSAELRGTDVTGTIAGSIEVSKKLAESRTMKDCLVSKWFTKAFGRPASEPELPSLAAVQTHFAANDDMKEIVLGLVQSPAFLYVHAPAP